MPKFHVNISKLQGAYAVDQRARKNPADRKMTTLHTCKPFPEYGSSEAFREYIDYLLENEWSEQWWHDFWKKWGDDNP